jgi:hypothetical protein
MSTSSRTTLNREQRRRVESVEKNRLRSEHREQRREQRRKQLQLNKARRLEEAQRQLEEQLRIEEAQRQAKLEEAQRQLEEAQRQAKLEEAQRQLEEAQRQAELAEAEARAKTADLPNLTYLARYIKHEPQIVTHHIFTVCNDDVCFYIFGPARIQVEHGECLFTQDPSLFETTSTKGMISFGKYVYPNRVVALYRNEYSKIRIIAQGRVSEQLDRAPWRIPSYPGIKKVEEPRVTSLEDLLALSPAQVISFVNVKDPYQVGSNPKIVSFAPLRYSLICDLGMSSFQLETADYHHFFSELDRYCRSISLGGLPPLDGKIVLASEALERWDEIGENITAAYHAIRQGKPARQLDCLVLNKGPCHIDTNGMSTRDIARLIHEFIVPLVSVYPCLEFSGVRCDGFVPAKNIAAVGWRKSVPCEEHRLLIERPEHYVLRERLEKDLYKANCSPSNDLADELERLSALKFAPKYLGKVSGETLKRIMAGEYQKSASKTFSLYHDFILPCRVLHKPDYFSLQDLALVLNEGSVPIEERKLAIENTRYAPSKLIPLLNHPIECVINGYLANKTFCSDPKILMIRPTESMSAVRGLSSLELEYFGSAALYRPSCWDKYIGTPLACLAGTDLAAGRFLDGNIPIHVIVKRVLQLLYPEGAPSVEMRGKPKEGTELLDWCDRSGIPRRCVFFVRWAQTQPFVSSDF